MFLFVFLNHLKKKKGKSVRELTGGRISTDASTADADGTSRALHGQLDCKGGGGVSGRMELLFQEGRQAKDGEGSPRSRRGKGKGKKKKTNIPH